MAQHLIEHSFLFTNEERESIYRSSSAVNTRPVSFVTRLLQPLWVFLSTHILSEQVAPNAVTMMGLLCCIQSYQIIHSYYRYGDPTYIPYPETIVSSFNTFGTRGGGSRPRDPERVGLVTAGGSSQSVLGPAASSTVGGDLRGGNVTYGDFFHANRTVQTATVLAAILLMISVACGSLDGVHAKRCRLATSLGDIFSRVCSSVTRTFIALIMLEITGFEDIDIQWYVLLGLQLIEFNTVLGRINAENIKKDKVKNWAYLATYFFRDAELSVVMLFVLVARWFAPEQTAAILHRIKPTHARTAYWILVLVSLVNTALLKMRKRNKSGIAVCLAVRVLPIFYFLPLNDNTTLSVVGNAMVVCLISIEVYVSHLAQRRLHAFVIVIAVGSLLNDVLALTATVLYIVGILVDLSYALNVPLFVPVRNVYIDGVFDLCHAGHKRLMANALRFGNRLIVGVCGDEECEAYKRRPIMTMKERINEVRLCKYVSEVIPNTPVSGVTEEMIRYYNIHVVVCGEEYNSPSDTFYSVPRRIGILRTAPRTNGISTSVLIARIRAASEEQMEANDKLSGNSKVAQGN